MRRGFVCTFCMKFMQKNGDDPTTAIVSVVSDIDPADAGKMHAWHDSNRKNIVGNIAANLIGEIVQSKADNTAPKLTRAVSQVATRITKCTSNRSVGIYAPLLGYVIDYEDADEASNDIVARTVGANKRMYLIATQVTTDTRNAVKLAYDEHAGDIIECVEYSDKRFDDKDEASRLAASISDIVGAPSVVFRSDCCVFCSTEAFPLPNS